MKAWELLSDRSRWTQKALARDEHGTPMFGETSVCWCAVGAIHKCYGPLGEYDQVPQEKAVALLKHCSEVLVNKIGDLWRVGDVDCVDEEELEQFIINVNDELGYDVIFPILKELDI